MHADALRASPSEGRRGIQQEERACPSPLWQQVFNLLNSTRCSFAGASFQPVGASFQLAHAFDTMKSCRHKGKSRGEEDGNDPGFFELWVQVFNPWVQVFNPWVQVFNPWVQVFNLHMPSTRWSLVAPRATGNEPSGVTQRRFSHGCLARLASQHGRKPTRMSLFLQSPIGFSFRRERIWQKVPV